MEASRTPAASKTTLPEAIRRYASSQPDSPAILSTVGGVVTYGELGRRVEVMAAWLQGAGLQGTQRIAIVLPAGGELAATLAAVTCSAVAVPMDPAVPRPEFLSLLAQLQIDAVLTSWDDLVPSDWPRRHECGDPAFAGQKLFVRDSQALPLVRSSLPKPDPLALILRTSGTTASPKLVAVSHSQLAEWADQVCRRLELTTRDRALGVAPLHYAQGLQTSLFAPLASGGSVAFPPRRDQSKDSADILHWIERLEPTWLSAGPTFYLNLIDRIESRPAAPTHSLRLLQSGGSTLPDRARERLSAALGVPILEAYGMSESGQVAAQGWDTSNRRLGTVGRVDAGWLAVVDDSGTQLECGVPGNIVIRGPGVVCGYIREDGSTQSLLKDGWFGTGDLGSLSADGFLTLTGRHKEIINRGGEKIAPPEVDSALCKHPDVQEAAAFGVPHPRLGEDVAAAVVLRPGAQVAPAALRRFLRGHLAPFKIPHQIQVVERLARGATGKIDRRAMARELLDRTASPAVVPGSALELEIVSLWKRLLNRETLDPSDDFFASGGDSLLAVQMREELEGILGIRIPDTLMLDASTARELAEAIVLSDPAADSFLIPLRETGSRKPLVFVDGDINGGGYYMRRIAEQLGKERPVWLLRPFDATELALPSIEVMASHYLRLMREAGLKPPFLLGGHCNGALLALEVARQAEAAGDEVSLVVMIDPISLNARRSFRALA